MYKCVCIYMIDAEKMPPWNLLYFPFKIPVLKIFRATKQDLKDICFICVDFEQHLIQHSDPFLYLQD